MLSAGVYKQILKSAQEYYVHSNVCSRFAYEASHRNLLLKEFGVCASSDSHNDICKHKDPNPDDPSNPEEAPTPNSFNSKLWWEASYAKREQTLLCP